MKMMKILKMHHLSDPIASQTKMHTPQACPGEIRANVASFQEMVHN